ncbi:MAG: hypothetical protein HY930_03090 [Euryarchaeota archaeon]|nr:hypothetical protein [Euryarchaeota archaeon]
MAEKITGLPESGITLLVVSAKRYLATNIEVVKLFVNQRDFYCIYVTLNRPFASLKNILEAEKIKMERMFFIDCITRMVGGTQRAGNVIFTQAPQNLTELSISITKIIESMPKEAKKFLFLDSLSTLLIYNASGTVTQFVHFLTSKVRLWGIGAVFVSLEKEADEKLLSTLSSFADNIVSIDSE